MQVGAIRACGLAMLLGISTLAVAEQRPLRYVGVTGGSLAPKYFQIDDGVAVNAGIAFGLRVRAVPGVAVEAIWTGSAIPRSGGEPGPGDNTDNRSSALFAAYRSDGDTYIKGRLGVGHQTLYDDDSSRSRTDLAGGVGLGWRVPEGMLEIEQSFFNADAWYISLSYFYELY